MVLVVAMVLILSSCAQLVRGGQSPVPGPTGSGTPTPDFRTAIPGGAPGGGEQETQAPPVTG